MNVVVSNKLTMIIIVIHRVHMHASRIIIKLTWLFIKHSYLSLYLETVTLCFNEEYHEKEIIAKEKFPNDNCIVVLEEYHHRLSQKIIIYNTLS